jgi:hypothetical protein
MRQTARKQGPLRLKPHKGLSPVTALLHSRRNEPPEGRANDEEPKLP